MKICRITSTEQLSKPMLAYWHLDSQEQISMNQNVTSFIQEEDFETCLLQNGGHFLSAPMYQSTPRALYIFNHVLTTWLEYGKQLIREISNAGPRASYMPYHSLKLPNHGIN